MGRDRSKENKDFEELTSVNSQEHITEVKTKIKTLISKDTKIIAKNESQKKLIQSIKNNEITVCAGPAGTGKTFVALALALSLLRKDSNRYKTIYFVKSVTPLKNEEVGFIKGDLKDKLDPVMWSFYINLEKLLLKDSITKLKSEEIIRPFPLAYMKGSSLDDCIIVADEMQNVSLDNSRTLLTRIGSNCKLIVLGDIKQIDLRNKKDSSLEILVDIFKDVNKIGVVEMSNEDTNVRNPLINIIEKKYDEYLNNNPTNGNGNGKKQQLNG